MGITQATLVDNKYDEYMLWEYFDGKVGFNCLHIATLLGCSISGNRSSQIRQIGEYIVERIIGGAEKRPKTFGCKKTYTDFRYKNWYIEVKVGDQSRNITRSLKDNLDGLRGNLLIILVGGCTSYKGDLIDEFRNSTNRVEVRTIREIFENGIPS